MRDVFCLLHILFRLVVGGVRLKITIMMEASEVDVL